MMPRPPAANLPAGPRPLPCRQLDGRPFRPANLQPAKIHRYRRFAGYDYARGASLFVTFTLARRVPAFGRVEGAAVVLSPAGEALAETLAAEEPRHPGLAVRASVIMPDHVHLRVTLAPGLAAPLATFGRFLANVKRWAKWKAAKRGVALTWQQGCHDRLCNSAEVNALVDRYIANNPLKWRLMHGPNPPLAVVEPFDSPRLPVGGWWTAVGNTALFAPGRPLAALRLSRRIPPARFGEVARRCLAAVGKGYVPASTFISPCERAVKDALAAAGAPLVRAVPDPLATVYRPKDDEPPQFAAGRLLLLSCVSPEDDAATLPAGPSRLPAATLPAGPSRPPAANLMAGPSGRPNRSAAWHGMNDRLAAAAAVNGVSLYVTPGRDGRLDWRFAS